MHDAHKRGSDTFKSIADYDFEYWRAKRSRPTAVAEIGVDRSVPGISEHLVEAHMRHTDGSIKVVN